jgi:hypothetical protein
MKHNMNKPAHNIGICKSWADGSRVSTFVCLVLK